MPCMMVGASDGIAPEPVVVQGGEHPAGGCPRVLGAPPLVDVGKALSGHCRVVGPGQGHECSALLARDRLLAGRHGVMVPVGASVPTSPGYLPTLCAGTMFACMWGRLPVLPGW